MSSNTKLGFWALLAIVAGSQIGTGILILPAALSKYGLIGIYSWSFTILGVLALAKVFTDLASYFPSSEGPHIYTKNILGNKIGFFVGWTYWVISWVSSTSVVIESIGYLLAPLNITNSTIILLCELLILFLITILNYRGVHVASKIEVFLVILKILPILVIPIGALYYFNIDNFMVDSSVQNISYKTNFAQIITLTVWGFVGLECATTAASSVENPSKIIPRAVFFGTLLVACLYFFNTVAIMGLIPGDKLMNARAPYVDAANYIFGGKWYITISIISSLVCIGTLNAWTLISGQIAFGLNKNGLFPNIFGKVNKNNAPVFAITISSIGIAILLIATNSDNMVNQLTNLINFSVIAFLFIYLLCSVALLIYLIKNKLSNIKIINSVIAILFVLFIIFETSPVILLIATSFTITGIPLYLFWYTKKVNNK